MRMSGPEDQLFIVEIGDIIQHKENHTCRYRVVQVVDDSILYCVEDGSGFNRVNPLRVLENPEDYFIPPAKELES